MECVTVDHFFCCLELEAGGYILGTLGIISSFSGIVSLSIGLIYALSYFSHFVELVKSNIWNYPGIHRVLESETYVILLLTLLILLSIISLIASIKLIIGTKTENHRLLVQFMIPIVIGIIISFIQLLSGTVDGVIKTIVGVFIDGYIFICLNSLYLKFKHMSRCKISEIPKNFA